MSALAEFSNHPADYIDRAQQMIGFLAAVIVADPGQMELTMAERTGLAYIMQHIGENLEQAMNKL